MPKDYLFFISHNSEDNPLAQQLYDLLLEGHPEWEDKIFLDCSGNRPLEDKDEWQNAMMKAVEDSRHLIFVTSKVEHLKEGNGWLYEEVKNFQNLKATRHRHGRAHKNVSYMGILLCDCNFERDLYSDVERGSTYRTLYNAPQHLVLGENTSLQTAKERVLEKVAAMLKGTQVDDVSLELLERVRAFREERIARGAMLAEDAIDDALLPPIKLLSELNDEIFQSIGILQRVDFSAETAEEEGNAPDFYEIDDRLSFDQFCKLVQKSDIQLLGRDGGCGKTTMMTKIFHHQLRLCGENPNDHAVPLYVDAKALSGKSPLILRYLAMHLMGEHMAMTAADTGDGEKKLAAAFAEKRQTPRYWLLIDGYNELPENSVNQLNKELREFLPGGRYESVRVIISGRTVDKNLPESDFAQVEMRPLGKNTVESYLHKEVAEGTSLLEILRIPMYLKLFVDTDTHGDIQNKADLLREFLNWQQRKDDASAAEQKEIAKYHFFLRHMLPLIAYEMAIKKDTFVITRDDMETLIEYVTDTLFSYDYRKYYGVKYRDWLKTAGYEDFEKLDPLQIADDAIRYYTHTAKILHQDTDNKLEFVHQVYRDFFCAWYIAEELVRSLKKDARSAALACKLLQGDILEFVPDLLKEKPVCMNWTTYCWDYSCNESSQLIKLLALCRQAQPSASATEVANVLNMLRHARQNNLSGLDLSGLDLTATRLQGCTFFQYDQEADYTTSFAGAIINRENLFEERHYHALRAACANDAYVACLDEGGFLKLWEKVSSPLFPVKTVTDVRYAVKQMLFSPDSSKIYAMTDHEIVEILIPEQKVSKAQMRVLYRSAALLQQIALNSQGELLFSTVANAFNLKKLSEPEAPDRIGFYGVGTVTAVNSTGTCLAYGSFIDYEGVRIFDLKEDGSWQERKFGYALLLEEFVLELEELFRRLDRYRYFAKENADLSRRCSFFTRLQQSFMDRTHDFDKAPNKIKEKCMDQLRYRGIILTEEEQQQLDDLVTRHQQRIATAQDQQRTLLALNGKRITGLSFHQDNKTLLVSGIIDYQEKWALSKKFSSKKGKPDEDNAKSRLNKEIPILSLVATVDTETMETRLIKVQQGKEANRAFYCGDDILVIQKERLRIYDKNGARLTSVKTGIHQMQRILIVKRRKAFYLISDHHIYEMDQNLRCIRSIPNGLKDSNLFYLWDAYGGEYLCAKKSIQKDTPPFVRVSGPAINLKNGVQIRYGIRCMAQGPATKLVRVNQMRYAIRNDKLISFRKDMKQGEVSIQQCLQLCGCDFRGIRGTAADAADLQTIWKLGGQTDPLETPQGWDQWEEETFVPSKEPFALPPQLPDRGYDPAAELTLRDVCFFTNQVNNDRVQSWDWDRIQSAIYTRNEMEETDYSVLEWVNRLQFTTEGMILALVEAGLIAQPVKHPEVGKQLIQSWHRYYKLLLRTRVFTDETPAKPILLTLNSPYGTKLVQNVVGHEGKDPLEERQGGKLVQQGERKILIQDPNIRGIIKSVPVNWWFALTARRYRDHLEDYAIETVMETDEHADGFARVRGYLRLGGQPFFVQSFRGFAGDQPDEELLKKVKRLCIISRYYRTLKSRGHQLAGMERQPVLVLIGEDMEQCRQLNAHVQHIYPNVRKLFTFDALLQSEAAAQGAGNYFEFCDGEPHSVKLETLIV